MPGERPVLVGLLLYLLIAVTPTVLFWLCVRVVPQVGSRVIERRRSRRSPPPGPPLERAVTDVRRLRAELCRPGRNQVRRVATREAYDDALAELCRILDVAVPDLDGRDRAYARLVAEAAVEDAGVALDPPYPHGSGGRGCAA